MERFGYLFNKQGFVRIKLSNTLLRHYRKVDEENLEFVGRWYWLPVHQDLEIYFTLFLPCLVVF
jgi:hypothetical protein